MAVFLAGWHYFSFAPFYIQLCIEVLQEERRKSHTVTSLHQAVSPWNWRVRLGLFSSLCAVANFVILWGGNVIHLKQIVCVPPLHWNIKQPRQGSPNCWRNIRNGSQVNSPCFNFLPRRNEIWICEAWATATEKPVICFNDRAYYWSCALM